MGDGFLGRWSRRKESAREGKPLPPEPSQPAPVAAGAEPPAAGGGPAAVRAEPAAVPPPTLEEAQALTPEADFTRFVGRDVAPDVKNTALKKLFADPHFNVMDRLDTYIDDYSQPDPIPAAMLRQMASAQFLKLFDEPQDDAPGREVANDPAPQSVAQSGRDAPDVAPTEPHADPDLRLQQDDAPGPEGPGPGAG